ncbi:UNVERIFIED_CONTAM: hypothetical protein NCL1_40563 [Trichonephila clavipes]
MKSIKTYEVMLKKEGKKEGTLYRVKGFTIEKELSISHRFPNEICLYCCNNVTVKTKTKVSVDIKLSLTPFTNDLEENWKNFRTIILDNTKAFIPRGNIRRHVLFFTHYACEDPLGSHFENEDNFESKKNQ